ncbi:MAG TPA: Holliday junction resolvase-like protein [bacterium]|nr:Holliday junction resolvase-like protein [bacterium]
MNPAQKEANKVIKNLESGGFFIDCPCCGESMNAKESNLFFLDDFPPAAKTIYDQKVKDLKDRKEQLKNRKIEIPQVSQLVSRAVNVGHILERMAPAMKGFRFDREDCRSLFDPIDYVVFQGMSNKKKIENIFFMDIKSGNARLNNVQREIKEAVSSNNVNFDIYEVPE